MDAPTSEDWKVRSIFHLNINCSDLERSIEFYETLGFTKVFAFDFAGEADVSYEGMGVSGDIEHRGPCVMFLGDDPYQTRLDLMQWVRPASAPHEPSSPTDLGVPRFAMWTKNIDALFAHLTAHGIEALSPPVGPFPERAIERVLYIRDPDGLIVEFIEFTPRGRTLYQETGESES
jgi:catechol 2,3-dioxygenase-like lactoylglutathione lyase family enzyme